MAAKYERWSVTKLKIELGRRCASTSGRKTDLIERLKSYDRNSDFKGSEVILPESLDEEWPSFGFQQLQPEHRIMFPKITREQIDGYFLYRMAHDNETMSDIKAMEKGSKMFAGHRILACSVHITKESMCLTGIVGASMKQKVTYNYKVKIDGQIGEPTNSHCECPAGKGPHATCKHIAAVLLMLEHFVNTGDVQVEKCCTQNLQTFYQPKSYYNGSPVKAENIPSKRKDVTQLLQDPRPVKRQHGRIQ